MKNGDTGRMIIAITYMLALCVLLVAGMQALPSGQPLNFEELQSQPRFSDSNVSVDMAVGK